MLYLCAYGREQSVGMVQDLCKDPIGEYQTTITPF